MSKNIKEFLHYYIGQKVRNRYHGSIEFSNWRELDAEGLIDDEEFAERQLLLRRLEDMTEEDIQLGDFIPEWTMNVIRFTGGYCIEIDSIRDDGYLLTIYPDGSMYVICKDNGENYPYKGAELFHQLLSRGFDLFGLVDAGLAIDAKTIKS